MKMKSINILDEQNKKRQRIMFRFFIITSILVVIGTLFSVFKLAVMDLYTGFVLDFIVMSSLYSAALTFCSVLLYLICVIIFFNPQQIKKSSVANFSLIGILILSITVFLITFSVSDTRKSIQDMKNYTDGEWLEKDLFVTDVYRASNSNLNILIETSVGELVLFRESFPIYEGQEYRFTYLDETKTIIEVEKLGT